MENSGLAIFASGRGSNAAKIIDHFISQEKKISCIVTNKPDAGVLELSKKHHIPSLVLKRAQFYNTNSIIKELDALGVEFIALAGFLWLIPSYLIKRYNNRILNIHPALLPKYGGKGMYGMNVHKAVREAGENETGLTIHLVNEEYDKGAILFQASCNIQPSLSADEIAAEVLKLEHRFYPTVIDSFIQFQS